MARSVSMAQRVNEAEKYIERGCFYTAIEILEGITLGKEANTRLFNKARRLLKFSYKNALRKDLGSVVGMIEKKGLSACKKETQQDSPD